jgi:hypothetical protein
MHLLTFTSREAKSPRFYQAALHPRVSSVKVGLNEIASIAGFILWPKTRPGLTFNAAEDVAL